MNKKMFCFIILILTTLCIMYFINKPTSHNNILGTYRNQENSFNTISFDTRTGEYIEDLFDPTNSQNLKNSGKFLQDNENIKFLSGKYESYRIKFESNILILFSTEDVIKFDKIDDVPIILVQ